MPALIETDDPEVLDTQIPMAISFAKATGDHKGVIGAPAVMSKARKAGWIPPEWFYYLVSIRKL